MANRGIKVKRIKHLKKRMITHAPSIIFGLRMDADNKDYFPLILTYFSRNLEIEIPNISSEGYKLQLDPTDTNQIRIDMEGKFNKKVKYSLINEKYLIHKDYEGKQLRIRLKLSPGDISDYNKANPKNPLPKVGSFVQDVEPIINEDCVIIIPPPPPTL